MKAFLFAISLLASVATARNSGIYSDDRLSVVDPPTYGADITSRAVNIEVPAPISSRMTNAERLRKRLPLNPPTRRSGAHVPRASCTPLSADTGKIAVRRADTGSSLGYIRKTFDAQNSYTYGNLASALTVRLVAPQATAGPLLIVAMDGPSPGFPLVGAVGGSAGFDFNSGQIGYAYLAATGVSPAKSPPSYEAGHSIQELGYMAPAESTIWSLDCLSAEIAAQWINVDGSQPSTGIFYNPAVDFLGLVGDMNQFNSAFADEGAFLVTLTFVPDA